MNLKNQCLEKTKFATDLTAEDPVDQTLFHNGFNLSASEGLGSMATWDTANADKHCNNQAWTSDLQINK